MITPGILASGGWSLRSQQPYFASAGGRRLCRALLLPLTPFSLTVNSLFLPVNFSNMLPEKLKRKQAPLFPHQIFTMFMKKKTLLAWHSVAKPSILLHTVTRFMTGIDCEFYSRYLFPITVQYCILLIWWLLWPHTLLIYIAFLKKTPLFSSLLF